MPQLQKTRYLHAISGNCVAFVNTFCICRYFGLSQPLHTRAKSLKTRSIRLIIFIWVITMVVCLPFIMCNNMQDSVIRGHNDVEPTFKNAFPAGMLSDSNHQRYFWDLNFLPLNVLSLLTTRPTLTSAFTLL